MGRLADKNILITGGNSGIGLAAAQEFDREGARVAICGLNEGSLQAAKETLGAGSLAVRADVSNLTDLDAMFATIKREFGHLDGVFVNAGYSDFRLFEDVTEQSFDKVIAVNFKGAYFTIQKALPLLRQGSSVIINASVGARKGWPTTSIVSTCKAAVVHLARILSAELLGRGIRVNTLSPGPTDTAMFGRVPGEEQGEAVKDILRTNNPSKRMADPLEIAKLAVYLASDDSAYVVGADFLIDGGSRPFRSWAPEPRCRESRPFLFLLRQGTSRTAGLRHAKKLVGRDVSALWGQLEGAHSCKNPTKSSRATWLVTKGAFVMTTTCWRPQKWASNARR